jgi:hypothetical protein
MEEMCRQQAEELELSRRAAATAAEASVRRAEAEDEGQELLESLIASKVHTRLVNCFVASGVCCLRAAVPAVILCEVAQHATYFEVTPAVAPHALSTDGAGDNVDGTNPGTQGQGHAAAPPAGVLRAAHCDGGAIRAGDLRGRGADLFHVQVLREIGQEQPLRGGERVVRGDAKGTPQSGRSQLKSPKHLIWDASLVGWRRIVPFLYR